MNDPKILALAVSIIDSSLKDQNHETVEGWLKAAFKLAKDVSCIWMFSDDESKFKAGVGAAFSHVSEEDQERIRIELRLLNNLAAMMTGISVDMETAFEQPEGYEPIHMMQMWKDMDVK